MIVHFLEDFPILSFLGVFAVLSPKIVRFLENSPMPSSLCDFAPLREIFLWLRLCRAKSLREISVLVAAPPR
jgi:hypothetical protein